MSSVPVSLLHAFVVFNESKNILEASSRLGISQPALSKQLRQLEDRLPQPVFTMSGRKKVLTPFGRDLHLRLHERLLSLDKVIELTSALHSRPDAAKVRIAGRRGVLDRISGRLPFDGTLIFNESSNAQTIRALTRLEAEIGIAHDLPSTHELVAKPLFREAFQLVIPRRLRTLEPGDTESLRAALTQLPCLGYREDDEILRSACAHFGIDFSSLRLSRATENYSSLAGMADQGLGWAILPAYLSISKPRHWIVPVPAKALPSRRFYIAYRRELATAPWFQDLLRGIRSCFDESL